MASTSEQTFGARVANAEALSASLKTFSGYEPPSMETSVAYLDDLIASTKADNGIVTAQKIAYSMAVDMRQKHFVKEPTSIAKMLSPILSAVKATLGKTAKEIAEINILMAKIRGESPLKPKEDDTKDSISRSERSYGSITQNFSDIVTTLSVLGPQYTVVSSNLKVPALMLKVAEITAANNTVTTSYSSLKKNIDNRLIKYDVLAQTSQRIKESVKSQFGFNSSEYNLIRGLKV
jgi:hypothetical protein